MYQNYDDIYKNLINFLSLEDIKVNEPMFKHTTFRTGGVCDIMIFPNSEFEFLNVMKEIIKFNIPYFILGMGSNIIVRDKGIRGIVINLLKLNKVQVIDNVISASSGAMLHSISDKACENSLEGFSFACGIPGTIGGAIMMNAGAYGGEISQVVKRVKVMDSLGNVFDIYENDLDFSYRSSVVMKKKYIVIDCDIVLSYGKEEDIRKSIEELTFKRKSKQPLEYASAGSIFKRPEGYFVGKMVEEVGMRGYVHKNVMVSQKHCGFIVSKAEKVSASEILELIDIVKKKVYDKFNVELTLEVKIVGEE